MSLLRLISNPAIMSEDAVTRSEAWRIIDRLWSDNRVLWAEELDHLESVFRAISARDDTNKYGGMTSWRHSLRHCRRRSHR
jgi:uncharacterized protein